MTHTWAADVPEESDDSADLLARRAMRIGELQRIYREIITWSISIGRLRITAPVTSNQLSIVFALWHLLAGAAGGSPHSAVGQHERAGDRSAGGILGKVLREDDVERMRRIVDEVGEIDRALAGRGRAVG